MKRTVAADLQSLAALLAAEHSVLTYLGGQCDKCFKSKTYSFRHMVKWPSGEVKVFCPDCCPKCGREMAPKKRKAAK